MQKNKYTLTEILVAVAVLMIMMTFLFEFIIGSQRIWSSSAKTASAFDKAQIVFSIMETDLKQALYSNVKNETIPMYLKKESDSASTCEGSNNTEVRFGIIARLDSKDRKKNDFTFSTENNELSEKIVKTTSFPLLYHFDRDKYRLYRLPLDTTSYVVSGSQKPFVNVKEYYGIDYTSVSLSVFDTVADQFDEQLKEILADDVLDFNIEVMPPAAVESNGFMSSKPKAVRINITLFDHEKYPDFQRRGDITDSDGKKNQEDAILLDARTFSKVIFLE